MRTTISAVACAVAAISISSADAAATFYSDQASFLAAASGIPLTTEDFEDEASASSVNGLTLNGSGITVTTTDSSLSLTTNVYSPGKGLNFGTDSGGTSVTFTLLGGFNAFGLTAYDLATVGTSTVTLLTSTGDTSSFTFPDQPSGTAKFFGAIDTSTIFTSLTFTNSDSGDYVELDNLQFGTSPVPEPSSLAIVLLGGAGLAARRRRKAC